MIDNKKLSVCKSIFSQFLGLMFGIQKPPLLFVFHGEKKIYLHTFFVFYPIDVYFFDKNKKLVEFKKNMKPFEVYFSKKKAMYVIEKKTN